MVIKMKTLENLFTRFIKNGKANINGRASYGMAGYQSELESKYKIEKNGNNLFFSHWGSVTLSIDIKTGKISKIYGVSKSDVDSISDMINIIENYYDITATYKNNRVHLHYYPSRESFEVHSFDDTILYVN